VSAVSKAVSPGMNKLSCISDLQTIIEAVDKTDGSPRPIGCSGRV
jgi:hypothetical protein